DLNDGDLASAIVSQLVGPVLDELIDLTVAVAAFLDVAFGVRVLLDESGIDPVRLQYARGLLVDELQYGGPLGAHCSTHLALIRMWEGGECVLLTQTGERGDRTGSARRSWPAARPLNGSSRTSPNHVLPDSSHALPAGSR